MGWVEMEWDGNWKDKDNAVRFPFEFVEKVDQKKTEIKLLNQLFPIFQILMIFTFTFEWKNEQIL